MITYLIFAIISFISWMLLIPQIKYINEGDETEKVYVLDNSTFSVILVLVISIIPFVNIIMSVIGVIVYICLKIGFIFYRLYVRLEGHSIRTFFKSLKNRNGK